MKNDNFVNLPTPPTAASNYLPFLIVDKLLFVSGQLPFVDGVLQYTGTLANDNQIEIAQAAAKICAINILAQLKKACNDDISKVKRCVKISGYVNSVNGISVHSKIIDAASNIICEYMGDSGCHTRVAIGCSSLPLNAMVEIEAMFELHNM